MYVQSHNQIQPSSYDHGNAYITSPPSYKVAVTEVPAGYQACVR